MSAIKTRIHEIDGLRGIAILSVVILHWIIQPLSPLFTNLGMRETLNLFAYGVDLFFVISGFLIGGILLKSGKYVSGIRSFYIRRILRIWPLYYFLLALVYLFSRGNLTRQIPYWSLPFFVFNFWESWGYELHQGLGPLWSIAIEEQFYAVGPLIFFALNRKSIKFLTGSYLLISPFLRLVLLSYTEIDVWRFTFTRLDGICMGILLAILLSEPQTFAFFSSKIKELKIAVALLFFSSVALKMMAPKMFWFAFGHSWIVLFFGCLLLTVQIQCALNQAIPILNAAWLRYLGMRCYFIYLFHIFFMLIASAITKNFLAGLVLQSALTVTFAHISWKYLEAPLIKFGHRFSYGAKGIR